MNAAVIAIRAAADAARRAQTATRPASKAALLEASGYWSILADLIISGVGLREDWVRQHALEADMVAGMAGEFAPPAHEEEILAAMFPRR